MFTAFRLHVRRPLVAGVIALTLVATDSLAARCFAASGIATASSPPPVRLDSCRVESLSILRDPFNGIRSNVAGGVRLRFVNERSVNATDVRIVLRYDGASETVDERGIFSPGVTIDRTLSNFAGAGAGGGSAQCSVMSIRYADGTAWTAP